MRRRRVVLLLAERNLPGENPVPRAGPGAQKDKSVGSCGFGYLIQVGIGTAGTCTGEHGIGIGKQDFMATELGETVDVLGSIKQALDPVNLMNSGKVFSWN